MKMVGITLAVLILVGCAATIVEPSKYSSIREYALADARANVPTLDRFALFPESTSADTLTELRFETGSYGEKLIDQIAAYCALKDMTAITDTNDLFGTRRPSGWLDGLNAMGRLSSQKTVFSDDPRSTKKIGGGIGFVACSHNALDIHQIQTGRHDVAWYVFFIKRAQRNSTLDINYTEHKFVILERNDGSDLAAFTNEVVLRLKSYKLRGT